MRKPRPGQPVSRLVHIQNQMVQRAHSFRQAKWVVRPSKRYVPVSTRFWLERGNTWLESEYLLTPSNGKTYSFIIEDLVPQRETRFMDRISAIVMAGHDPAPSQ
ncbi:hypothetical protein RCH14_002973 [Massilia sp. MP_M2]|uniref:hypothetical protein n=1 Tax=Massilia sp. MP_M2 TaxID=3071713 RepID=UPI00319DD18F